jgi:hypothetical protein
MMQQTWTTDTVHPRRAGVPPSLWDLGNEALFHFAPEALARPAEAFGHPRDVVRNPRLSVPDTVSV